MTMFWKNVLFITVLCFCVKLYARNNTAISLHDLPKQWKGDAGDLFNRYSATLTIKESTLLNTHEKNGLNAAIYSVKSDLKIGARKLEVKEIHISGQEGLYELTLVTYDKLVPNLFAIARKDANTGKYTLKESPRKGSERRFILEEVAD